MVYLFFEWSKSILLSYADLFFSAERFPFVCALDSDAKRIKTGTYTLEETAVLLNFGIFFVLIFMIEITV
jgi:hypothetical protein